MCFLRLLTFCDGNPILTETSYFFSVSIGHLAELVESWSQLKLEVTSMTSVKKVMGRLVKHAAIDNNIEISHRS